MGQVSPDMNALARHSYYHSLFWGFWLLFFFFVVFTSHLARDKSVFSTNLAKRVCPTPGDSLRLCPHIPKLFTLPEPLSTILHTSHLLWLIVQPRLKVHKYQKVRSWPYQLHCSSCQVDPSKTKQATGLTLLYKSHQVFSHLAQVVAMLGL